jgi:hypothetical protein
MKIDDIKSGNVQYYGPSVDNVKTINSCIED